MPVEYMIPDGDGNYTGGTASGCSNDWECLDDPVDSPDDDSTHVAISLTGRASVTFPNYQSGGQINSVAIAARARTQNFDAGNMLAPFLRVSLADYDGSDSGLTTSYQDFSQVWATNPDTGAVWTYDDLDTLEAGALFTAGGLQTCRITQLYAAVNYTSRIDHAVNGGSVIHGVNVDWQRIPKRKNAGGSIDYQDWALCTWQIDQLEMSLYLALQALGGQVLSSLTTSDIDRRNFQRTYSNAEVVGPVNAGAHVGLRATDIRVTFRVGV